MRKPFWALAVLSLCLVLAMALPSPAQQAAQQEKPPIYTYVATWSVPRAQWADMEKQDQQERPLMDKLVANGTLIGYGGYTNLIHQEGEPTHGTWFSASSEGNLMKALEAVYAQPAMVTSPVQGASKHWDYLFRDTLYNAKAGTSAGYLTWSEWQVKDGQMRAYQELSKSLMVPMLEKLLAEGAVSSYGTNVEDYHQDKIGRVFEYITVPDAASLDKVNQAFDNLFKNNPALGNAFRALVKSEGHRDFLTRLRYMVNK